ncbi:MAG: ElyC/SanA/YdcF family protein [Deltaproteobacteria bacterium]
MEQILFVAQKIILRLIFPVSLTLLAGIAGILLWRHRRLAFPLVLGSMIWLFAMSFPVTGLLLVRSVESRAGPYADPQSLKAAGVRFIVVLSGHFREGDLLPTDQLGCSLLRLVEGIRLWRRVPGCKLVLTGGVIPGLSPKIPIAQALAKVAVEMGVPRSTLILESASWTTADQAKLVARIVGRSPFALVTSAYHMPRSILLFRLEGLKPIPAPADFLAKKITLSYDTLIPQAGGLMLTQIGMKERLGMWRLKVIHRFLGDGMRSQETGK